MIDSPTDQGPGVGRRRDDRASREWRDGVATTSRPFRPMLAILAGTGLVGGALLFLENAALEGLTLAITQAQAAPRVSLGVRSAGALAVLFIGLRLAYRLDFFLENVVADRLRDRGRSRLEAVAFERLARAGDALGERRPGDLVDGVLFDVERVASRRVALARLFQSVPLAASTVVYLATMDARIALLACVAAGVGVAWTVLGGPSLAALDGGVGVGEGAVKRRIQELLRGDAELDVHDLPTAALGDLGKRQALRARAQGALVRWRAMLEAGDKVTSAAALAAVIVGAAALHAAGVGAQTAALVPVLVRALPHLLEKAGAIAAEATELRRASASVGRLEAMLPPPRPHGDDEVLAGPARLELRGASYRHGTGRGLHEATFTVEAGRWIAVVGPSGGGKSTLIELILGRHAPQDGTVRVCGRDVAALPPATRASIFTFMPQGAIVVEGSIEENLALAAAADGRLDAAGLQVVEATGLGALCRRWALDRSPGDPRASQPLDGALQELRVRLRERLAASGVRLVPLVPVRPRADPWLAEVVCGAPLDHSAALAALLSPRARRRVARAASSPGLRRLAGLGAGVLADSAALLAVEHDQHDALAPRRLPREVWRLRREVARSDDPAGLALVALLSSASELGEVELSPGDSEPFLDEVRRVLARAASPLRPDAIVPVLTWRENLLLAAVEAQNERSRAHADRILLEAVAEEDRLSELLLREGLRTQVGREGALLSGGQRQLVALSRALLRRTPVLVLDEPTSALDPASRQRVTAVLRAWAADRIVVSVTHDPAVARAADEYLLVKDGGIVERGAGAEYRSERLQEVA